MRIRLIAIALLSIVLLLLLDSATDDAPDEGAEDALLPDQDYDYRLTGVDNTRFDLEGNRSWQMRAARLTHYPEPDHTLVESPDVVIFREEEPPWFIKARSGRVNAGPDGRPHSVELAGDVELRHADEQGRELNIYTDFLTLYPDTRTAGTDSLVRMETEGARLSALGMAADLNSQHIQLLGEGRGIYDP